MKKNIKIFCDFDGTISITDNIVITMETFAPSEWKHIYDQILKQDISIEEGISAMFSLIPSHKKNEMIDYVLEQATIRPGFESFVEYTAKHDIVLKIISGGMDFFIYPLIDKYIPHQHIYCNNADFSQDVVKVNFPHPCDEHCNNRCGCCKTSIIRQLATNDDYVVVIGDSITDLEAAKVADLVLACDDFLIQKCEELNLKYQSFATFYDVMEIIDKIN